MTVAPSARGPAAFAIAIAIGLGLFPLTAAATGGSAADPATLLERMQTAVDGLDYEGTFVYVHEGRLDAMRILHRAEDGREQERLIALNGARREVVRDGDSVLWLLPDEATVMVDRTLETNPFRDALPTYDESLDQHYAFEALGSARIAGRLTTGLAVRPKDDFRYGYRLWLDSETGMPLKSELVGTGGETVEQVMFTSLRLGGPIPEESLRPASDTDAFRRVEVDPPGEGLPLAGTLWQVERLPPGFRLSARNLERLSQGATREQLVFSDGLASVSVFVERARGQEPPAGSARVGAMNATSMRLDGYQVTVIGEVPAGTVRLIADSVNLMAEGGP